jgi:hypothetical protein
MADASIRGRNKRVNSLSLIGRTFGSLTVLADAGMRAKGKRYLLCRCVCGVEKERPAEGLIRGSSTSCGCTYIKAFRTHGMTGTPEHQAWGSMKVRCTDPNDRSYANYGGRGITVCGRWADSFEAFFADVGPRTSPDHSLDRIDNDKGYEPGNVRWATPTMQGRNRRTNRMISFNGTTQCLQDWADGMAIDKNTLVARLNKYGWALDRALTTPARKKAKPCR